MLQNLQQTMLEATNGHDTDISALADSQPHHFLLFLFISEVFRLIYGDFFPSIKSVYWTTFFKKKFRMRLLEQAKMLTASKRTVPIWRKSHSQCQYFAEQREQSV